ncbi:MAG TPA: GNAT family N-acetyltransferase [Acidimicrobiales bacterium]|nr:GNAT family N-acetyltransferase [Acidimicrobiales bacterium]
MSQLIVGDEPITSHGALSVYHAAVDELNRRYEGSDEGSHLRTDELVPPHGLFLVARLDAHPVGGVGLRTISDPALLIGEIKRLWVRPDQRRRGVGARLMDEAEARARAMGFRRLYLETGYAQPEAVELYRRSNWNSVHEYPSGAYSYPGAYRFTKAL